jgi:hypothetical protein
MDKKVMELPGDAIYVHDDFPGVEVHHPAGVWWDSHTFGVHDWAFMFEYVLKNGIKTVIEFGSGLSSLLLSQVCRVDSLENWAKHAELVAGLATGRNNLAVHLWDGVEFPGHLRRKYDMAFIDGPDFRLKDETGVEKTFVDRQGAFGVVAELTDRIFVHDALWHFQLAQQVTRLAPTYNLKAVVKSDPDEENTRKLALWTRGA